VQTQSKLQALIPGDWVQRMHDQERKSYGKNTNSCCEILTHQQHALTSKELQCSKQAPFSPQHHIGHIEQHTDNSSSSSSLMLIAQSLDSIS